MDGWEGVNGEIGRHVNEETHNNLGAYREQPNLVEEHFNTEEDVSTGGYGQRQLHELIQNGADALWRSGRPGRVHLLLTSDTLYCANEGDPIDSKGVTAILLAHMSGKKGAEIGRFGLGFKAVLGVSKSPSFYSRSGSFYFDAERAQHEIHRVTGLKGPTPTLRLAWPLDPDQSVNHDEILTEFMQWATTVVKLPLVPSRAVELLSNEVSQFPAEFLLFTHQVSELVLDDPAKGTPRVIHGPSQPDGTLRLEEGDDVTNWRLFQRNITVESLPQDAREDGHLQIRARETIPLNWAVQLGGRRRRSCFWAFFPTETETTLSGILNAPWRINSDRQNLLPGTFNDFLLDYAIELVAEVLPELLKVDDPGGILDLLPARAQDSRGWADRHISEKLDVRLRTRPCVPNRAGVLLCPEAGVRLRPEEVVRELQPDDWAPNGQTLETATDWCHPSVETRRARAQRLGATVATIGEWLEDIAAPGTPEASSAAVAVAGKMVTVLAEPKQWEVKRVRVVLTRAGTLASTLTGLYLDPGDAPETPQERLVHEELGRDQKVAETLRKLGVREKPDVSLTARLREILSTGNVNWSAVWQTVTEMDPDEAVEILRCHREFPSVMTLKGEFRPVSDVLLPGPVVPGDGSRDARVAVDTNHHRQHLSVLRKLGLTNSPVEQSAVFWNSGRESHWYREYERDCESLYRRIRHSRDETQPREGYLCFQEARTSESTQCPGPLGPLLYLGAEGAARFVDLLLPMVLHFTKTWNFGHTTFPKRYPTEEFDSPPWWMISRYGHLHTSFGPKPVVKCVHPALDEWGYGLPVAQCTPDVADMLNLPQSLETLPNDFWEEAFDRIQSLHDDKAVKLYGIAASLGIPAPEKICCRIGQERTLRPPCEVSIADTNTTRALLETSGSAWLMVHDRGHREALIREWGLQSASIEVQCVAADEDSPVLDRFPGIRRYGSAEVEKWVLRPCWQLYRVLGDGIERKEEDFVRVNDVLYYREGLDETTLVYRILQELGQSVSEETAQKILDYLKREDRQRRVARVRACPDLAGKLIEAVGEDRLRDLLPHELHESLPDGASRPETIANVFLTVFGEEALKECRDALDRAGFAPPGQWNGKVAARRFVAELGFPEEFAGFGTPGREPWEDAEGPVVLKQLHPYQETISQRIETLLSENPPGRGLLSLPTGSGKTRVVVEALIRGFKAESMRGLVLWIAGADELCEQAVQCWRQAWRALGPSKQTLRISRLWSPTSGRVVSIDAEEPHVVVATYQTLYRRLDRQEIHWLKSASCVIVDEAHGSVTHSYTRIFEWLDLTSRETSRTLIALTATPYRGDNEVETLRLVHRYKSRRLDDEVFPGNDAYSALQEMEVLAQVDHDLLEGAEIFLDADERQGIETFGALPPSAEERLGRDEKRNSTIVDSICQQPADWPMLVFATSVPHANLLVVMLSARGIKARAISYQTHPGFRRYYVEEFREGRLRVLTNYKALTTGFDAPAIRALYITRPVFSRGLYQQMIGRGLRGPLNGGKDRCLIVNVNDNILQYGEQLAFRHFEPLWRPSASRLDG